MSTTSREEEQEGTTSPLERSSLHLSASINNQKLNLSRRTDPTNRSRSRPSFFLLPHKACDILTLKRGPRLELSHCQRMTAPRKKCCIVCSLCCSFFPFATLDSSVSFVEVWAAVRQLKNKSPPYHTIQESCINWPASPVCLARRTTCGYVLKLCPLSRVCVSRKIIRTLRRPRRGCESDNGRN